MYRVSIFIILFSAVCLASCKISNYAKEDKGQKCELHQLTLHRSLVRITYGLGCSPKAHLRKYGKDHFPNARHQECGGCIRQSHNFVWIYSCSKCNNLKRRSIFLMTKKERKQDKIRAIF